MRIHSTASLLRDRHHLLRVLCSDAAELGAGPRTVPLSALANLFVAHVDCVRRVVIPALQPLEDASPDVVLEHLAITERGFWRLLDLPPAAPAFAVRCLELQTLLLAQLEIEESLMIPPLLFLGSEDQRRLSQAVELHGLRCARNAAQQPNWFRQGMRQALPA